MSQSSTLYTSSSSEGFAVRPARRTRARSAGVQSARSSRYNTGTGPALWHDVSQNYSTATTRDAAWDLTVSDFKGGL